MPRKTTFNLYVDYELIELFEEKVGKGNVSEIIEELIRNYLKVNNTPTKKDDLIDEMNEKEAMQQIEQDPYNKLKFQYEKSKDLTLTAQDFVKRLNM